MLNAKIRETFHMLQNCLGLFRPKHMTYQFTCARTTDKIYTHYIYFQHQGTMHTSDLEIPKLKINSRYLFISPLASN